MQFIVPQFIDVEDKVIGPFSFKQFLYLAGGAGLAFALFKLLPTILGLPLGLAVVAISLALTFFKVNGKPFIFVLQAFIFYALQSKLYIWRQQRKKEEKTVEPVKEVQNTEHIIPRLTESKLGDLSWSLDILDMKEKGE